MVLKAIFFVLVVSCAILDKIYGEDCVPGAIQIMILSPNATLWWQMAIHEPCEITQFEVDIKADRGEEYHFNVTEAYIDLSFLERNICEEWRFTVTPISHGVIGFARTLTEYIPLPPEADLSLSYFNATVLEEGDVLLEWDLLNHTYRDCTLEYHLTVSDEDLGIIQNVYIRGMSLNMSLLSPCVSHELSIRAVNRGQPAIEGPQRNTSFEIDPKPQVMPELASLDIGVTSINMTWTLEGGTNRCPLKALYIDAGNLFNISVPLLNSINPEPAPVELKSLQPNSMYFFRVYVENSGGISPAAQIAVQTLELGLGVQ